MDDACLLQIKPEASWCAYCFSHLYAAQVDSLEAGESAPDVGPQIQRRRFHQIELGVAPLPSSAQSFSSNVIANATVG
jgi:hypothetical protein